MKRFNFIYSYYLVAVCLMVQIACKKAIEIGPPPNVITTDKVFDNNASAIAATLSNYTSLGTYDANFIPYAGLYTDEFTQTTLNTTTTGFATDALSATNSAVGSIWQYLYVTIYKANANISGLTTATSLTDSVKRQCMGEALFVRAYCHFNLVNIFGDVPLVTTTDVTITANAPRTPVNLVYNQIVADLLQAKTLLTANYPTAEKIRPNLYAASALLSRVYLYQQNWANAEAESSTVIGSGLYSFSPLGSVFYKNSSEAIWQLWNTNGFTTLTTLVPPASGIPSYTLSNNLSADWESGDLRKANWTKTLIVSGNSYSAPYKYKLNSVTSGANAEYTMYLRLAEQYLIRAEARAQQNSLAGAIADINIIRSIAGLTPLSLTLAQPQVLAAIAQERRVELFGESGHRFFDLKRTGQLNSVMSALKTTWNNSSSPLFPIPQGQLSINAALIQNPGY